MVKKVVRTMVRTSPTGNKEKSGFTLLELLVVLLILGSLATLAPMAMRNVFPSLELKAAAYSLADTARNIRSRALARNEITRLIFNSR